MKQKIIQNIDWQKINGLLPVIVQDFNNNSVLMLAYMNQEALQLSIQSGFAHYFSRTKQRIWKKGETSGHTQKIKDMFLDCDNDTLLIKVEQKGVACHTGRESCFFKKINEETIQNNSAIQINLENKYSVIDQLYHIILERKLENNPDKSYTAKLFNKGENTILKKVVEEAGEFCFAVKDKNNDEVIYELADLIYHSLVALAYQNIHPEQVKKELKRRFGIGGLEEKASRNE